MPQVKDRKVSITQRAQAMALLEYGVHINEVATISKLSTQTLYNMRKRLRERGYNPEINTAFEDRFFKDAPRSGRPTNPDSRRSVKKAAKRNQSSDVNVHETETSLQESSLLHSDETIDPALPLSIPQILEQSTNVNYRPAPYRKDLNRKTRNEPKVGLPPDAIFVGNGWHGETVDNIAGLYAGVTDSALTNHGVLQAKKLGTHLATRFRFTHMFSSDLQRAYKTAIAVQQAQHEEYKDAAEVFRLKLLQEQDFGSFEKMTFAARAKAAEENLDTLKQPETKEAMTNRANQFLDDYLIPLLCSESSDEDVEVAVVSHGLILSTLWRCLLRRLIAKHVEIARGVELPVKDMLNLEHIGAWTNTGYLNLRVELIGQSQEPCAEGSSKETNNGIANSEIPNESGLNSHRMTILGVNCKEHLQGLKRTGGGVGSSKHDDKQKSIDSFFKKPRIT